MAVSVAVAVGDIADELINNISIKAQNLKISPLTNSESDMGPLISKQHLEKVTDYINTGVKEGADLILDGRNYKLQGYEMVIL